MGRHQALGLDLLPHGGGCVVVLSTALLCCSPPRHAASPAGGGAAAGQAEGERGDPHTGEAGPAEDRAAEPSLPPHLHHAADPAASGNTGVCVSEA